MLQGKIARTMVPAPLIVSSDSLPPADSTRPRMFVSPEPRIPHGILGSVRNYCGDSLNAIKNVREALLLERIYPPWLINILATAYRDSGNVQLSIPAAKEALRLDSQQTEARVILCSDYNLENSRDDARQIAREIIAANSTFRLSTYAEKQPYKYSGTLGRIIDVLRVAGLPD